MDSFVIRTPTWKTLNHSTMTAQSSQKKSKTKKALTQNEKKPLMKKHELSLKECNLENSMHCSKQTNRGDNFSDSGLSSASSFSPQLIENDPCEKLFTPTKNHLNCPVDKENDTYMTITHTPRAHKKMVEPSQKLKKNLEVKRTLSSKVKYTPEKQLNTPTSVIMARIQRDLNSPSAGARVKAIKAMKSPTKSAYAYFDIPEVEQSLHLPEPPSLKEILRNIVVYVEVRSGEDNRSAGVRKVIEAMGARICLSLNRETTHVVFKDGLLSTFKKAKQLNIPIVSILWIESCKNQHRICDPKDFPISNLDRYENPELYTKMKRVKSMQPDSECNKRRVRAKASQKDYTPTHKTGNLRKTSVLSCGTPNSSTNKKKTDISQFFKKIEGVMPSSASKADGDNINGITIILESPATQLLNRIHSECYTPLAALKNKTDTQENNNNIQNHNENSVEFSTKFQVDADKSLKMSGNVEATVDTSIRSSVGTQASPTVKACRRSRRHSLTANSDIETATYSMNSMVISISTPNKFKVNRHRSSTHTPKDMSMTIGSCNNLNNIQPILEESNESDNQQNKPKKSVNTRRTLYTVKTMDETELMNSQSNKETETSTSHRRILFNTKPMDSLEIKNVNNEIVPNVSNRRRTFFDMNSRQLMEETTTPLNMPVKTIHVDLTNELDVSTPPSSNRRGTIYVSQTHTVDATTSKYSNITLDSSSCQTPTNFQMGTVISSTLLDDDVKTSKLATTPMADMANEKLVEEREQCTTPLIFSSTRQPGNKRRTLFDVSMDIITQRLQCINQSARRSLVPLTPSAGVVNNLDINTPVAFKTSNNFFNSTTPKSSTETLNECTNSNDGLSNLSAENNVIKKKRKLFMPNETLNSPTPPIAAPPIADDVIEPSKIANNNISNSAAKRRRTLMPISQPQPTTITFKNAAASIPVGKKRRSTLDFEQIQNVKTKVNVNVATDASSLTLSTAKNNKQQVKAKKPPVMVYTNMHQQQIDVIREAIDKLGLFVLEDCVTNSTTHLVSLEPRRTLNLLRALVRGLWILDYSWILESRKAGKWLPEEPHELQNFSRAIEICRSEREAFGNNYKCDLFCKFGAFYISSRCSPISKEDMRELISLCGGHVVNVRQKARYIIGDTNKTLENKLYITPYWVLDSITQMQLMKVHKYISHSMDGKLASQP